MKRWEQLYVQLQRKAEQIGYDPPLVIGSLNSQTYEFQVRRKPVLLLAFRDLGLKPDYSTPDELWAEGLDLVLKELVRISQGAPAQELPPALAIVIDNIGDSYVVVSMNQLFDLYSERVVRRRKKGRQFTFKVRRRDGQYFLPMSDGTEVHLTDVNTMEPIVKLLKKLK